MNSNRSIIFFIGPPGAGKGTQSILLEERCGLKHLETSSVIEDVFKNRSNESGIKEAKLIWSSGKLLPSTLVANWILNYIKKYLEEKSVVMSGSPKRLEEFLIEMPEIEKHVSKENIIIIHLPISKEESVRRNTGRRICTAQRHPIPGYGEFAELTKCPKDGSDLVRRELDTKEIIEKRYEVYLQETYPILELFKKEGYKVIEIKNDSIEATHKEVVANLKDVCNP